MTELLEPMPQVGDGVLESSKTKGNIILGLSIMNKCGKLITNS